MMQTIDTKNELNIARCTLICMIFTNPFELMSLLLSVLFKNESPFILIRDCHVTY